MDTKDIANIANIISVILIVIIGCMLFKAYQKEKLIEKSIEELYIEHSFTKDSLENVIFQYQNLVDSISKEINSGDTIIKNIIKVYEEKLIDVNNNNITSDIELFEEYINGEVSKTN